MKTIAMIHAATPLRQIDVKRDRTTFDILPTTRIVVLKETTVGAGGAITNQSTAQVGVEGIGV
jgi:hypothetical protein